MPLSYFSILYAANCQTWAKALLTNVLVVDRYLPSGALDWRHIVPGISSQLTIDVQKVLIRPDGKILVAYRIGRTRVVLLRQDGLVESTFGTAGHLRVPFVDVEVMSDNRLITLGSSFFQVFDANGELVQNVFLPYPTSQTSGYGRVAVGPDGRLVVASTSLLTRYNADLTPDNSFCAGGPCPSPFSPITYLRVANDGKIVTGSSALSGFQVARHLPNGDVDEAFGIAGVFNDGMTAAFSFSALEVDDMGRILVAVSLLTPGSYIRIIDADGSAAQSLGAGLARIWDIALQEDGKLLATGPVLEGTILRRYHYTDERKSANLRFATTKIIPATGINRGDEIEYVIRVVNEGPNKAGHLTFENLLPNGASFVSFEAPTGWVTYQRPSAFGLGLGLGKVSCSGYRLESGQIAEFRLTLQVKRNVPQGAQIVNTSTVTSLVHDPIQSNNTTTATVTVQ